METVGICVSLHSSHFSVPLASLVLFTLMTATLHKFVYLHHPDLRYHSDVLACARIACFVVCYTLVRLRYCIGLSKSILEPKKVVPYLGFECDSSVGAFRLLPEKREKLVRLLESLLSSEKVSLTDLQRLSGKCMSVFGSPGCQTAK